MPRLRTAALILALTLAPAAVGVPLHAHADPAPVAFRTLDVVVDGAYVPNRLTVASGERVRLRFIRSDYGACTREVVFPSLGIRRTLPTGQPVIVELPALEPGEVAFHCGMHMIHGTVVVTGG